MQGKKADFEEREYGKNPFTSPCFCERLAFFSTASKDEAIKLMLKDPNLLRRPVIIKGKKKLTGFSEAEVKELL